MLLRAAIVMLVMLNLGAAGWWWLQPVPAPAFAAAGPGLQLVSEAPAGHAQRAAPASPQDEAPAANPEPRTQAEPGLPVAAPICLRLGPFAEDAARTAAAARLTAAGLAPVAREEPARAASGWNVYLPPQPSREAAQALADKLKADGVADLYVLVQGEAANSIALGRFSSEAGALRRQQQLQAKGVQARIEATGGGPAQRWLDVRLPAQRSRTDIARIAPARPLDCARLR